MANELKCENCCYCYYDEGDEFPYCHFPAEQVWWPAPCEEEEPEPQDDPAIWDD